MLDKQAAVREFMIAAQQHVPTYMSMPSVEVRKLRINLIAEELHELAEASGVIQELPIPADFEHVADAIADLLYVVYGAAVAYGIDIDPVFAEVHRSNMTKFIDGSRREDGKWQKGPSYTPANVARVLTEQHVGNT